MPYRPLNALNTALIAGLRNKLFGNYKWLIYID